MTGFNDSTVHDFSMYYPKGQLWFFENILNTNSKPKIKRRHDATDGRTDGRTDGPDDEKVEIFALKLGNSPYFSLPGIFSPQARIKLGNSPYFSLPGIFFPQALVPNKDPKDKGPGPGLGPCNPTMSCHVLLFSSLICLASLCHLSLPLPLPFSVVMR